MNAATTTPLEWADLWAAMDAQPAEWIETTEAMYWQMLEVLPPRLMSSSHFMVGEPKTHNAEGHAVHACFWDRGGRFFAKHMTVQQFRSAT
jgi:hypothetical protein